MTTPQPQPGEIWLVEKDGERFPATHVRSGDRSSWRIGPPNWGTWTRDATPVARLVELPNVGEAVLRGNHWHFSGGNYAAWRLYESRESVARDLEGRLLSVAELIAILRAMDGQQSKRAKAVAALSDPRKGAGRTPRVHRDIRSRQVIDFQVVVVHRATYEVPDRAWDVLKANGVDIFDPHAVSDWIQARLGQEVDGWYIPSAFRLVDDEHESMIEEVEVENSNCDPPERFYEEGGDDE